jgi:hypothetical protein
LHYDSTRVGSSSDHTNEVDIFGLNRSGRETSSSLDKSKKPVKRSKRITSSQKKGKVKPVTTSRIKVSQSEIVHVRIISSSCRRLDRSWINARARNRTRKCFTFHKVYFTVIFIPF